MTPARSRRAGVAALLVALAVPSRAQAPAAPAAPADGQAACHEAAPAKPRYDVSAARYDVPDVTLIDDTGRPVSLKAVVGGGQPVALNFIFTTCTTICPVMTATFAQMRRELGDAGGRVRLVSISIDPDQDRPEVLHRYAERYGAGWTFLTGGAADVERTLRAFGAFAGSKMNHRPLTLLKPGGEAPWVRIDGLASGGDLAREVRTRLLD